MAKKHLALFKTQSEYEAFRKSDAFTKPNISYIEDVEDVFFHELVIPPKDNTPMVKMTFNATEDNLLAFNSVPNNVTSITVDDQALGFTPIEVIETVGYVTNENFDGITLPENIVLTEGLSTMYVETLNNEDEFTGDCLLSMCIDGYGVTETVPLSICVEGGMGILSYDAHKITFVDGIFNEMGVLGNGLAFIFYTSDNRLIETKQTNVTYSGGWELPLLFDNPGVHTVHMSLSDDILSPFAELSASTLSACELENITTITESMFEDCSNLSSVVLGDGLKYIHEYAFSGCSGLVSINMPTSLISIDNGAFYTCTSLPVFDNVRYADTYLVEAVDETLSEYNIKEGTKWISNFAFRKCSNLTSIVIPDSIISIGHMSFEGCKTMSSITLGSGLTIIDSYAFSGCTSLSSITIPDSVTSIDKSAFNGCSGLSSIVVSEGNTVYDSRENCNCIIKTSTNELIRGGNNSFIPDSVTTIGENAFHVCKGLTSITIPASVTSIGDNAFQGCSNLTSIIIPDSVTSIGHYAFYNCSNLTSITIPDSVTEIGNSTFQYCSKLTSIVIPDSVTTITYGAFSNCSGLTDVTLGSGLTIIENAIFYSCTSLSSVTIPNSVISIGSQAFQYCSNLTSIVIPDSVTGIGDSGFSYCTSLASVTLGSGLTTVGDGTFSGCTNLALVVSNAVTAPTLGGSKTFYGVANGGTLYVPSGSTGYDAWMSTNSYYLGYYNWTQQTIS